MLEFVARIKVISRKHNSLCLYFRMASGLKPLPPNKDGYRYHWGEDDEPLCSSYIRELNALESNKRNYQPAFFKRKLIPSVVRLSENDRAPQLKLDEKRLRVTGEKGYSMVRATHCINRGTFYYEVYIESMPENTASRIGWGQKYANLQAPLGYDHFGYSWRSRLGTKFHQAKGHTYDKNGGYKRGDTLGCMIELPYGNERSFTTAKHLPQSIKSTCAVVSTKKSKDTFRLTTLEEDDKPPSLDKMVTLNGSRVTFYKNGQVVGVAYEDIFEGFYYPSISLYKNCVASVNFGPDFKYPPKNLNMNYKTGTKPSDCLPYQAAVEMSVIDNFLSDMIYVLDQENDIDGRNKLDDYVKKQKLG